MAPSEISLRALRTCCNSLSIYSKERASGVSATYSSRPTSASPPLSILPPPDSRAYYDRSLCEQRELSRKIYAVRDAYNSVLTRTRDDEGPPPRVMTLAGMCAAIAGRGLEYQPEDATTLEAIHDWDEERAEIYEAIPQTYRRTAIRSQALDIILSQCPHHFTLLSILLDTTLAHGLACEAPDILRLLLHQAVRPRRVGPPSLLHPAHTLFLVDLLRRWTAPSVARSPDTFVHALLDVLDEETASEVWSSKTMDRLARELWRPSLPAFLDLAAGLVSHIAHPKSFTLNAAIVQALEHRLHGWLLLATRHCFRRSMLSIAFGDDSEYDAIRDFLRMVHPMMVNCPSGSPVTQDVLCLATEWLVARHNEACKSDLNTIRSLIRRSTPGQDTYKVVVAMPFTDRSFADQIGSVNWLAHVASAFSARAHILRQHGLANAEAMLWASVLREVERPTSERVAAVRSSDEEVHRWREQVVLLADEAETRCRGGMTRAGWARENMVDCWDDQRPVKKAKRAHPKTPAKTKARSSEKRERRATSHYDSMESPVRSRSRGRENKKVVRFRASSDTEEEEEDGENVSTSPRVATTGREERLVCTPRRRFSSILSSALVNMTTVHTPQPKVSKQPARTSLPARGGASHSRALQPMSLFRAGNRASARHRWSASMLSSDEEDVFGADDADQSGADEDSLEDDVFAAPSSDDPLDMFMYATSPVRC
ncbi:hypothetical protein HDZ31DRAFT_60072 [Schizophyllum fasciatum]